MHLVRNDVMLSELEVADSISGRLQGLLGRSTLDGAMQIVPAKSVHTLGMKFSIDVAYCDKSLRVIAVQTMKPYRVGLPRIRANSVIEASAGAFTAWNIKAGDQLEITP